MRDWEVRSWGAPLVYWNPAKATTPRSHYKKRISTNHSTKKLGKDIRLKSTTVFHQNFSPRTLGFSHSNNTIKITE